jgi:hypothetical protein
MFLVPLILKLFGKSPPVRVNFSREDLARHVRDGSLRITCQTCACPIVPNQADWLECSGCGKAVAPGDRMETLREIN